ncbi:MAG TPA: YbaL family putative K(+) efflux transporter [Gemmatimonadales bacterium]|jgi:CPA2 family monovalent cation:H+ antiporter-2|nr:YbaL family putative K(+) efflux transporter [Gemmatimonadales bacterium]
MPHDTALIVTIAGGIGLAFLLGMVAQRLRLPPLVGYLIAGIIAGPYTPGFVADTALAQQLAEIGVILLMFGVGVHFSLEDLLAVRRIAVPGAVVQIAVATVLGGVVAHFWGWSWATGIVFGLCLSVASTVVLLRALESRGVLDSVDGRIAIGWLIVEDLATVLVLVMLPALAVPLGGHTTAPVGASGSILVALGVTIAKVVAFVALMVVVGRRAVPWLLERVARTGSRELFTLGVLAVAIGVAVGAAALFGVSFALGAFVAGMVVNGTDLSHEAAADSLPLQDAFAVLFFVAVGMLFDPAILVRHPFQVLAVVGIVMIGKSLGAFFIVLGFRYPVHTALTISASLAQIGEFSFILAALAVSLGLMPAEAQSLIVAGALLSIALNSAVFATVEPARRWITARPRLLALLERPAGALGEPPPSVHADTLRRHAVIVGYGRVGGEIGRALAAQGVPYLVLEQDRQVVMSLRERGIPAFFGDASRAGMLDQVNVRDAQLLVVTAPEPFTARAIIAEARKANPAIDIVVRTHTDDERRYLEALDVGKVVMGERELARAMAEYALRSCGTESQAA